MVDNISGTTDEIEQIKNKASPDVFGDDVSSIPADKLAWRAWEWIDENLNVHYVPDGEDFIVCDGGVWRTDNEIIGELTARLLTTSFKPSVLNEVRSYARNMNVVRRDELGVANGEIPFENGVLNLETRELRDIEPEDYVIRPIPHEYDPAASYRGTTFRGFMRDVVPDEEQRLTLQEFTGYLFVRGELPYQKAMMLVGEPAAGKGSFLRIVQKMLGEGTARLSLAIRVRQSVFDSPVLGGS